MMEKRQKELIIFAVAIGVLALLVVMTLGKGRRSQSPPTVTQPEAQAAAETTTTNTQATTAQAPGVADPEDDKGPLVPYQGNIVGHARERDPFIAVVNVGFGGRTVQTASAVTKGSVSPVPTRNGSPPAISLPPFPNIFGPVKPVDPTGSSTVATPAPAQDPLVLTGIIQGDPPVAVFRRAEKRFIVKPGDEFAGYQVTEIAAQRVALARGSKHHSLSLGGKL